MKYILGISSFYHDSAVALINNGEIISAVQEERFTRIKHDASFPINSIKFVLNYSNITLDDIDYVVFYDKPFLKFERLTETYLANVPKGFLSFQKAMPIWLKEKLFLKTIIFRLLKKISKNFDKNKLLFSEHHFSHAASAFYPSPFEKAVVLTLDGVGEWATSTISIGNKNDLEIKKEIHFPHSLGLLYSSFTLYLGFKVNSGEYKLMGLAPYGKPKFYEKIRDNLVDIKNDGSFRLNQKYFNYMTGLSMINSNFEKLFGQKSRLPNEQIEEFHMDIASSIQKITEDIILLITDNIYNDYGIENLCLAGGVALNCVANTKIKNQKKFKNIWIQPASGDAGGALGAAYAAWFKEFKQIRKIGTKDKMKGAYLGPSYKDNDIKSSLLKSGAIFEKLSDQKLNKIILDDLIQEKAIGWFQGRMEFGPRALGARSIIADPRSTKMQRNLNLKVKFRESFRPFAPSIINEKLDEWFDLKNESPYMLFVANVNDQHLLKSSNKKNISIGVNRINEIRSIIPAITHVDNSARIQTVHKETNEKFHSLIMEFFKKTGVPILVNTSFNVRGEPIVCSPEDAFNCFMGTNIDSLVIGNFYLQKQKQKKELIFDYKDKYDLD